MPKSRVRKKKNYSATGTARSQSTGDANEPSPQWVPITAVSLIAFGIGWLVLFYLSGGAYPVAAWQYWNLAVGFSAMVAALIVLSKWK
ncbi:cell division protein CrgA [Natronoglycomyces albus]|uniref:Cell division protein CrgA n=1 Tax=Natronoglycomyces albus TaxID=2811108 RepID=A0A895XPV0_9ACTN|nr:cell division protein CrgA [Natronoglycomyces albus]QSB05399.1 cell division protein CrgA [Natronoglycomyces albus]